MGVIPEGGGGRDAGTLDILLLEDTPTEAALIERIVRGREETAGHGEDVAIRVGRWHHVETLADAMTTLDRVAVDVVISDLMVPDSRGVDTIGAIVRRAPRIPVIALTSHDAEVVGTQTIQAGAQDYLVKGRIDAEVVGRSIRYAIQRKRHELELIEANQRLSLLNRIVGHDIRREMSVAIGWAGELADGRAPETRDVVESLNESLETVVDLADAAAEIGSLVERTPNEAVVTQPINAILAGEIDRFTARHPSAEIDIKCPDSDVAVLATPMLGSVFKYLFTDAMQNHGSARPKLYISIEIDDTSASVIIEGEGVELTEEQIAFLDEQEAPPESAHRTGTGLYLASTILEQAGGRIGVDEHMRIVVTFDRPPGSKVSSLEY